MRYGLEYGIVKKKQVGSLLEQIIVFAKNPTYLCVHLDPNKHLM
jgi:hypothetical protein